MNDDAKNPLLLEHKEKQFHIGFAMCLFQKILKYHQVENGQSRRKWEVFPTAKAAIGDRKAVRGPRFPGG